MATSRGALLGAGIAATIIGPVIGVTLIVDRWQARAGHAPAGHAPPRHAPAGCAEVTRPRRPHRPRLPPAPPRRVSVERFQPWTDLGVRTVFHWRLVTDAALTPDDARRWATAGLDARFAAAATGLGADLRQVRDLVQDYLQGTGGLAHLDDAWIDLVDTLDCQIGPRPPRNANDAEECTVISRPVNLTAFREEENRPAPPSQHVNASAVSGPTPYSFSDKYRAPRRCFA
jgi:hypothetical protein